MEVAEFDTADFQDSNNNRGVYARFYYVPRRDEAMSAEAGRPVFVDREYVEIIAAGNANNIVRRPASEMDKHRFRAAYEKFKQGDSEQMVGTPLGEVAWLTRSQVEELMYRKIRTLEELSEISDAACSVPGMYELRRKAKAWLESAKESAPFTKMQEQISQLTKELEAMRAERKAATESRKG